MNLLVDFDPKEKLRTRLLSRNSGVYLDTLFLLDPINRKFCKIEKVVNGAYKNSPEFMLSLRQDLRE